MYKKCSCCKEKKDKLEFGKDVKRKDNLNPYCKSCRKNKSDKRKYKKKEYDKNFYESNKDEIKLRTSKYYKENREHMIKKCVEYRSNRLKTDLEYRLKSVLRCRLYKCIKSIKDNKQKKTLEYLGCSIEELKNHIEKSFTKNMSWNNYGEWHIDHIIPCSSFNLINEIEIGECFHYTNLQPLWAIDNLKKSNKLK